MPLKIYYSDANPLFPNDAHAYHDIYLNFEKHRWILTDNISEADVIPAISFNKEIDYIMSEMALIRSLLRPTQILLVLSLFHSDDWMSPSYYRDLGKYYFDAHQRTIFAHTNTADDLDPQFICLNLIFNREKLYMTDTPTDPDRYKFKAWFRNSFPEMYSLSPVTEKSFDKNFKHIICPNRIIWNSPHHNLIAGRNYYKNELRMLLLNSTDPKKYYLSDPDNGIFLKPNGWDQQLLKSEEMPPSEPSGIWLPIGDYYYQTSYASVFVESNHGGELIEDMVVSPTEKYFDPLIKGHFPIGFSAPGTIRCLREKYGFEFPNWIDYSYDLVLDSNDRFKLFIDSVKQFLDIPLEKLHELYVKDIDILKHNQRIFFDKPYYSLHDKVQHSMKQLGW